ncbi:hypothetical protein DFH06DRAFT_1130995 [Mycena polygramma]|nr:hypothetical protein DFH06DRAFT_1130995 [Mycena polygramma]
MPVYSRIVQAFVPAKFNRFNPSLLSNCSWRGYQPCLEDTGIIASAAKRRELCYTHGRENGIARQSATFGFPPGFQWNPAEARYWANKRAKDQLPYFDTYRIRDKDSLIGLGSTVGPVQALSLKFCKGAGELEGPKNHIEVASC